METNEETTIRLSLPEVQDVIKLLSAMSAISDTYDLPNVKLKADTLVNKLNERLLDV